MSDLNPEVTKLKDGSELYRISWDGKAGSGDAQFVSQLMVFQSNDSGRMIVVDDILCGVNMNTAAVPVMALELNVFDRVAPEDLDDNSSPTFKQSVPIGFNQTMSPEAARWTQNPWAFAKAGQMLQIAIRSHTPQDAPNPVTVQFRKRIVDYVA